MLKEQLAALAQIQALDLKIDHLKKNQAGFPASLQALDERRSTLLRDVEQKSRLGLELERLVRQNEGALALNQDRLIRATDGAAFPEASKEVADLKRLDADLLARIARIKADLDQTRAGEKAARDELATLETRRETQASENTSVGAGLDREIATIEEEKQAFLPVVKPQLLVRYNRIRAVKAGVGITSTVQGRCGACHMIIPAQMYNELQKGLELHACPTCYRILF